MVTIQLVMKHSQSCPEFFGNLITSTVLLESLDQNTLKVIEGISSALVILIDAFSGGAGGGTGGTRRLFDESIHGTFSNPALISFCLRTNNLKNKNIRSFGIRLFLQKMASALQINTRELVLAYMIVECVARKHQTLVQNKTVRLVFLTAVSIVMKLVIDCEWFTTDTFAVIQDLVPGIQCHKLAEMEWRILTLLDYTLPIAGARTRDSCVRYMLELMAAAGVAMSESEIDAILEAS